MVAPTPGSYELRGASTLMGLLLPEIQAGGLVRVLENPIPWEGIKVGEIYPVHKVTGTMFAIQTEDWPNGAYFMREWGEPVWD